MANFQLDLARGLMMREVTMNRRAAALLCAASLSLHGCVTDKRSDGSDANKDAGAHDASRADSKPLLPWKVGNQWTYRVTGDTVTMKTTTIGEQETVGGSGPHADDMAFKVVTEKADGTDKTISWQVDDENGRVLRYREQSFSKSSGELTLEEHWDPYKLHIDGSAAHTKASATWLESYAETKLPAGAEATTSDERDRWTIEGTDETVTVPAGTFKHALLVTKAGGSNLKSYWYVRGIGKIKETGGQTEELVSYEVAP